MAKLLVGEYQTLLPCQVRDVLYDGAHKLLGDRLLTCVCNALLGSLSGSRLSLLLDPALGRNLDLQVQAWRSPRREALRA